ncbi:MAG: orotate phosphoribosyltransferase, partial [Saprospiraceae bacterium]
KDHGLKNLIEGRLSEHSSVLVIEDLISTGGSSLDAVEALEQESHKVLGVLSIFQYGFASAKKRFQEKNMKYSSLTDFETLLARALSTNHISNEDYNRLQSWNIDPKLWSETFVKP